MFIPQKSRNADNNGSSKISIKSPCMINNQVVDFM